MRQCGVERTEFSRTHKYNYEFPDDFQLFANEFLNNVRPHMVASQVYFHAATTILF